MQGLRHWGLDIFGVGQSSHSATRHVTLHHVIQGANKTVCTVKGLLQGRSEGTPVSRGPCIQQSGIRPLAACTLTNPPPSPEEPQLPWQVSNLKSHIHSWPTTQTALRIPRGKPIKAMA